MPSRDKDNWSRRAEKEGHLSRAVYKLQELDKRYKLLRKRDKVLELGAAPGSWIQYTAKVIGNEGQILALDLEPITITKLNIRCLCKDVRDKDLESLLQESGLVPFRMLLSDLAPHTTGDKFKDRIDSYELSHRALELSFYLVTGGNAVIKILSGGEELQRMREEMQVSFREVRVTRTRTTRVGSEEHYLIGRYKK